jgi:hypothetical protein
VQAGVINVEGLGLIPVIEMRWHDERTVTWPASCRASLLTTTTATSTALAVAP